MRLNRAVVLCFVLAALVVFQSAPAFAQQPTEAQLQMLQNLTPEQRQMIMDQLGASGNTTGRGSTDRRNPNERERRQQNDREMLDEDGKPLLPGEELLTPDERRDEKLRLKPGDTVIVQIDFPPPIVQPAPLDNPTAQPTLIDPNENLEPLDRERLQRLIDLIRLRNPYTLDRNGALLLPGFDAITLAGLLEEQATQRVDIEPRFDRLEVKVLRLPVTKTGIEGLKPFGYNLFESDEATYEPITDVPVPSDYIVGPGDELQVQLYGNQNRTLRLTVGRDGRVNFPELGPISVAGQRFTAVKSSIEERVNSQMIGVRADVSMGDIRSIQVFVLGEAKRPGTYTISGLATIMSGLYAAGGVKDIGSLRNIQLKRQGKTIRTLDLYDLLTKGDTSDDAKLLPGDAIFIPPVGPTIALEGEVRRPAIYELKDETQVGQLLQIAGGLAPEADASRVSLARLDDQRRRRVVSIDLSTAEGRAQTLQNGDQIRVGRVRPTLDSGIVLQGYVYQPGLYAHEAGMRLSDVIRSVDELKPNADLNYVLIRRELPPDRRIVVLSADLAAALRAPGSDADPILFARDQINVFDTASGRENVVMPLLNDLRLQGTAATPTSSVKVDGRVKVSGEYPLEQNMTVSDLVRAGGGLEDSAFAAQAELTRYRVVEGERQSELIEVDLAAAMRGDAAANIALQPFDLLIVKEVPEWRTQEEIELLGEVKFPGRYPIRRGETLRSVLERAGGLTDLASARAAIFTREELKEREEEQLKALANRIQSDLTALALGGAQANQAQAGQALAVGQSLLTQLEQTPAVGRLVIDLPSVISSEKGREEDIVLRGGDKLMVPKQRQEVTVIGEVQNSTSHFYRSELSRNDYISLSGGTTRKADDGQIYVVRADGTVVGNAGNRWFSRSSGVDMLAGDTVVVPLDTERLPPLPLWQAVTQILYNLAVSVAAVNSF